MNKNSCAEVEAPAYLRDCDIRYNFKCLLSTSAGSPGAFKNVPILDLNAWPTAEDLELDKSQYAALQTAMTKEIVTIQGPPGTGKTFIGLKIVQLLLENKSHWNSRAGMLNPILIVCYTNHALDQFLEGIMGFDNLKGGGMVRVGGRTSPDSPLRKYTINEIKRQFPVGRRDPLKGDDWMQEGGDAVNMYDLKQEITQLAALIKGTEKWLVHEQFLRPFMTPYQIRSLFNRKSHKGSSVLPDWLKLRNSNVEEAIQRHNAGDYVMENDPDEIARIQEDRMFDDDDMLCEREEHLKEIEELSEVCEEFVRLYRQGTSDSEWQVSSAIRKAAQKEFQNKLRSHDTFTTIQANDVRDVWDLGNKDRWRLYKLWVSKFCEDRSSQLGNIVSEYNRAVNRMGRIRKEEDLRVLRRASVIGMTTTGAARIRDLLHRLQPRIVIVEEAAEVLEAHIVTSLSKGCEHLIMIGDHQQLRPSPAVYKLARTYHMDISLFERMVKNNLRCDRLAIQHRMRPEIAGLIVPSIYKDLENHESVHSYEHVKGVGGNVFFIKHTYAEDCPKDSKSRFNRHEALYVASLTKYFLQQGYRPTQITVLTTYVGQVLLLRQVMQMSTSKTDGKKSEFEGVRLTSVDNYQGEENDIIILSLVRSNVEGNIGFLKTNNRVCVALSRARMGLFIIGNMDILSEASILWHKIASYLENGSRLVEALPLSCQNHPDKVIHAANQEDFKQAPEGGCLIDCGKKLGCGHICKYKCHPVDQKHINEYKCSEPCSKILCVSQHRCPKKCQEPCSVCKVLVEKIINKCGHTQKVPCYLPEYKFVCKEPCHKFLPCGHKCQSLCGEECTYQCEEIIPSRVWPECGHTLSVECYRNPTNFSCTFLLDKPLPCGHVLNTMCSIDTKEVKCSTLVDVSLCGDRAHTSRVPCHQKREFMKSSCRFKMQNVCPNNPKHVFMSRCSDGRTKKCASKCNVPLECGHGCSRKCNDCNDGTGFHHLCKVECEKILTCGHQCKDYCGQICPPCSFPCEFCCDHLKCSKECSDECDPCEFPCDWNCLHFECDRICAEPCTRPPCNKPCDRKLDCNHSCMGLCGEPCPKICRHCTQDRDQLQQLIKFCDIKDFSKKIRFIELQPCGDIVEVNYMDLYVENSQTDDIGEPKFLACPICNGMVSQCPRYNKTIKRYVVQMNDIKRASKLPNRILFQLNVAVSSIWPVYEIRDIMERLTTQDCDEGGWLFRGLACGILCLWFECWKVLIAYKQKSRDVEEEEKRLHSLKPKVVASFQTRSVYDLASLVISLQGVYLQIHMRRLITIATDGQSAKLKGWIDDMSDDKCHFWSDLETVNGELKTYFDPNNRESIQDHLNYLGYVFHPVDLRAKKWLVCGRGEFHKIVLFDCNPVFRWQPNYWR